MAQLYIQADSCSSPSTSNMLSLSANQSSKRQGVASKRQGVASKRQKKTAANKTASSLNGCILLVAPDAKDLLLVLEEHLLCPVRGDGSEWGPTADNCYAALGWKP